MAKRTTINTAKAATGVVVLLIVAVIAGVAGVHTLANVLNPNKQSRLQRYAQGGDDVVTKVGNDIRLAFPKESVAAVETVHLPLGPVQAERRIATVSDESVEVVWFRIQRAFAKDANVLPTIATFSAADLRGTVHDAVAYNDAKPKYYEFRVPAPVATTADTSGIVTPKQHGDYYVRVMIDRNVVYLFRVRAQQDGVKILHYFAGSYCTIAKTCAKK